MKTLYIHIGTPKTATTSIQYFCNENREVLEKSGFYFPVFPQKYKNIDSLRNAHFLFGRRYTNGRIDILEEKKIFRACMDHIIYMFSKFDNILLSDEGIWSAAHFYKKNLWEDLKTEAERNNFSIKIIVYFRRQDKLLNSIYNQKIKKGFKPYCTLDWESFVCAEPPAVFLDYYEGLTEISQVLGKENIIVRRYGKRYMKNHSIYEDFLSALGLKFHDGYSISKQDRNVRITGNSVELKRVINNIPDLTAEESVFLRKMVRASSAKNPDTSKLDMFSPEEAEAFMESYRIGNQKILKEYIYPNEAYFYWDGDGDMFDMNFSEIKKWTWDSRSMDEELIRFISTSLLALQAENNALRKEIQTLTKQTHQQKQALIDLKNKLKHPVRTVIGRIR